MLLVFPSTHIYLSSEAYPCLCLGQVWLTELLLVCSASLFLFIILPMWQCVVEYSRYLLDIPLMFTWITDLWILLLNPVSCLVPLPSYVQPSSQPTLLFQRVTGFSDLTT